MSKRIIIIGCGIAGPVLAMLLKYKGFDPVIYERQPAMHPEGIALGVSPQTLKVLNILGIAERVVALGRPMNVGGITYSQITGEVLGQTPGFAKLQAWLGWPLLMISRPVYHQCLISAAEEKGIKMHFGKKFVDLKEQGERVTAIFEDGTEAEGDLLIGCDGLHSGVRNTLFGKEEVTYMGLSQVAGYAPIPEAWNVEELAGRQYFGDGAHFLCSPINDTQMVWVNTFHLATPVREDWRRLSIGESRELLKTLPAANWENGPKDLLETATFATRWGLYDRPILPVWHKGRAVLLGDAAHPTSPHLGQGANQAMEDCYHLVRLLVKAEPFTDASLEAAFTEYESIRVPIVVKSVGQAKKEGERRVMSGKEECAARDAAIKEGGGHDPERMKLQMELIQGPFMGESEI